MAIDDGWRLILINQLLMARTVAVFLIGVLHVCHVAHWLHNIGNQGRWLNDDRSDLHLLLANGLLIVELVLIGSLS